MKKPPCKSGLRNIVSLQLTEELFRKSQLAKLHKKRMNEFTDLEAKLRKKPIASVTDEELKAFALHGPGVPVVLGEEYQLSGSRKMLSGHQVTREKPDEGHKSIEQAITADRIAKKSYDRLLANGLKNTKRLKELMHDAVMVLAKGEPTRDDLKEASYFPKRIRSLALDIERHNANPIFIPEEDDVMELPKKLRDYASFFDNRYKLLRQGRKGRPKAMAQLLKGLRYLVRTETGNENRPDLDKLLTAMASAAGKPMFNFEAALRQNAHRYPLPSKLEK